MTVTLVPPPLAVPVTFPSLTVTHEEHILRTIAEDHFPLCEILWELTPELYKEHRLISGYDPLAVERYRGFLRSIDAIICSFRTLITEMITCLDPAQAPYALLPYLAPLVGIDFNYDLPEAFARREITNAIFLWERKGTRDNLKDWIRFLSGIDVTLREFSREVLRWSVWEQAHPEITLPHRNEHHAWSRWAGRPNNPPWYHTITPDTNYGFSGFGREGQRRLPGYLLRNHVGIYLEVPDSYIDETWFGTSLFTVFNTKITRIIDLVGLYGVIHHLFWRLFTEEDPPYCGDDSTGLAGESPVCNVTEELIDGLGETVCTLIESPCEGRLADLLFCWSNPNAFWADTYGYNIWSTQRIRYWDEWVNDTLETWDEVSSSGTLLSSVILDPELSNLERTVQPFIGTATGQGLDSACEISEWVLAILTTGFLSDTVRIETWENPFTETVIHTETWNTSLDTEETVLHTDTWNSEALGPEEEVHTDTWNTSLDTEETVLHTDTWEDEVPFTISGLTFWLDASYGVLHGSPVSSWLDKSGNGHHAVQGTSTAQPAYLPIVPDLNYEPAILFDGVTEHLRIPHNIALNTDVMTIFIVGIPLSSTGIWAAKNVDQTHMQGWSLGAIEANSVRYRIDMYESSSEDFTEEVPVIFIGEYDQTELHLLKNGGLVSSTMYGSGIMNSSSDVVIGAAHRPSFGPYNVDQLFSGMLTTVLYYNRALSFEEKAIILNYLSERYSIPASPIEETLLTETWEVTLEPLESVWGEEWESDMLIEPYWSEVWNFDAFDDLSPYYAEEWTWDGLPETEDYYNETWES